jgi:HlyD family secretion protein
MNRMVGGAVLAMLVLGGLLGWKILDKAAALEGPPGGSGTIEGREVRLSSRVGGRIARLEVAEGDAVQAGDLLVSLDCVEPRAMFAEAEARLAAAREQAAGADSAAAAAEESSEAAAANVGVAAAQARALSAQGSAAARQAVRLDAVDGDVSVASRDQARSTADGLDAQEQAAHAQRRAGAAQARAATSQAKAASSQARAAHEQVAAAEAGVSRAQLGVDECEVRAPSAGEVRLLPWEPGELVQPGATLAVVVDLDQVRAAFYLPNAELGAARPGGTAELVADAWPDRAFRGTVRTVATEPEFTPRNIQTRTDRDRLVYRVEVDVANADRALRPGMPVEVRLVGLQVGAL